MLLQKTASLEDLLIRVLARSQGLKVGQLQLQVEQLHRRYSHQAIYKELKKLQGEAIVVKLQRKYFLSRAWVVNLLALADQMYDSKPEQLGEDLSQLDTGSKRSWTFSNLLRLDDFWIQAILNLLTIAESKHMYQWHPHAWYYLAHGYKSDIFHNALRIGGYTLQRIIGGDSFLDRKAFESWPEDVMTISMAAGPFERERSSYYNLIDDFILTVKLDAVATDALDEFYERVDSTETLDISEAVSLMGLPGKHKITLEKNRQKANTMRRKFTDYFAICS